MNGFLAFIFVAIAISAAISYLMYGRSPRSKGAHKVVAPNASVAKKQILEKGCIVEFRYAGRPHYGVVRRPPRCNGAKRLVLELSGRPVRRKTHQIRVVAAPAR